MICFITSKFDILGGNQVRGAQNAHRDLPHALLGSSGMRFRKRWAWPKIMICFIPSKFIILQGNQVRGARNAHRDFPHALSEAVGMA
jgi:hypothetical protein